MRRRTLLLGLGGAAGALGMGRTAAAPAAGVLASTKTSTLTRRVVTPYVPVAGTAPRRPFAAGRRDFAFDRGADRPLPTRVWYPSADGTAPAAGTFPLVVFSHGLQSQPDDYAAMLTRWARAGFVVAAPIYPHTSYGTAALNVYDIVNQPADASAVLTRMLALNGTADPLAGHLDPDRLAAAGHSAGAITTTGMFSADRDPRLTAGIVLAGTDFRGVPFTGPPAAMLFVHGRQDDTVAYGAGHTVYQAVPWSRAMLSVNAGHQVASGSIEAVTRTSIQFLRWSLYGDPAGKRRIRSAAATGDVATLEDQL
jgi:dienelactone hydrolase